MKYNTSQEVQREIPALRIFAERHKNTTITNSLMEKQTMALSWNEIKDRAVSFSKEWADASNEEADAKPFLVEFFNVFGISRKRVSTFVHRVKNLDDKDGYIVLLWKGTILIPFYNTQPTFRSASCPKLKATN